MSKPPDAPRASPVANDLDGSDAPSALTRELTRVEEANRSFYEAFRDRDIDRMSRLWAKSPHTRCVHPGWELVVGWTDIRQSWSEIFRTINAAEFELEDVHVEVAGRTAWANLIAYVRIETDEGESFHATMVTTNIFERVDGQWLLVLHHSSNMAEDEDEDSEDFGFESSTPGNSEPN